LSGSSPSKLEALGVTASYSRPHVSDDNPYSEVLFRTVKYRPDYPYRGFESLEEARRWVLNLCVGTTMITSTALSVLSLLASGTTEKTTTFWPVGGACTKRPRPAIRNAEVATSATGSPFLKFGSTHRLMPIDSEHRPGRHDFVPSVPM